MNEHEGYIELGLVGFTDRGEYSPDETYVKNDLVHLNNAIWKCLQDNTSGIEPAKNENWSVFVASENDLSGITAVDEHGVLGDESAQVPAEDLVNALAAPEFDDSGTVDGISGFQDFLDKVKSKMKLLDFFKNFAAGMKFVLHAGQLVNNCTSESADLPLAAAQGKVLMDLYTQLNSNLSQLNDNDQTTLSTEYIYSAKLYRKGVVVMFILGNPQNLPNGNSYIPSIIPEGYRPIIQFNYDIISPNLTDAVRVSLYPNGDISIYNYSQKTERLNMSGIFTYITGA